MTAQRRRYWSLALAALLAGVQAATADEGLPPGTSPTRHIPPAPQPRAPTSQRAGPGGVRHKALSAAYPLLIQAYEAYDRGRFDAAGTLYAQALAADAHNPDAYDGLAALALRQGRREEAAKHIEHALAADPQDDFALASSLGLGGGNPREAESRLKTRLAEHPDSPCAVIALGNLLAGQQRWAEARETYLQAARLAPQDPDVAYKLAVSLDHLGQYRLAAERYRQALRLTEQRPANFDRQASAARLQILNPPGPGQ